MEILNSSLNFLIKKFNNHLDSMRKDSILQNYYYSKLPKAEVGQQTGDPNKPYDAKTNPEGYFYTSSGIKVHSKTKEEKEKDTQTVNNIKQVANNLKKNPNYFKSKKPGVINKPSVEVPVTNQQRILNSFNQGNVSGAMTGQELFYDNQLNKYGKTKEDIANLQNWTAKNLGWIGLVPTVAGAAFALPEIAGAASATGIPAAIGAGLEAPLFGTLGAGYGTGAITTGNLLNAGFAYKGAKNIPNVVKSWQDVINDPTWGKVGSAIGETALTTLDMLPFVHGASKSIPSVMEDINQATRWFNKPKNSTSLVDFLNYRPLNTRDLTGPRLEPLPVIPREPIPTLPIIPRKPLPTTASNQLPPPPSFITIPNSPSLGSSSGIIGSSIGPRPTNIPASFNTLDELNAWYDATFPRMSNQAQNITNDALNTLHNSSLDNLRQQVLAGTMTEQEAVNKMHQALRTHTNDFATWNTRPIRNSVNIWSNTYNSGTNAMGIPVNKSGFTAEEVAQQIQNKEDILKLSDDEFKKTILKPTGDVAPYTDALDISNEMSFNSNLGKMQATGTQPMSEDDYVTEFNSRLDLLNDIIARKNTTGVDYSVTGLDKRGVLNFTGPTGNQRWSVNINPGQWRGEVQDIPNSDYYRSIPGLDMSSSSSSVFGDYTPRRGSGAYESINEYLKALDLGRVKPGFNSQSSSSKPLWENAIKKGNAFGFYSNPHTIHGAMKVSVPLVGAGTIGAGLINSTLKQDTPQQKYGGTSGSILEKYYTSKLNKAEEGVEVGPGPRVPLKPGTLLAATKKALKNDEAFVAQQAAISQTPPIEEVPVEKPVPVKDYNGISVVDFLSLKGYPTDKEFRKHLAEEYQIENYDFSAKKNLELLAKLKEDDEILKEIDPDYVPIPVEKLYKKEVKAPVNKSLPKKKTINPDAFNARLNLAMMDFRTPAGSRPNLGFLNNRMSWRPAPSAPAVQQPVVQQQVVQQPVAQQQGLNPAVLNMMLSTQPSANQTPFVQIPNNPFGSITGGSGVSQQTMVTPPAPGIDNGFRAPYQQTQQSFNYPIFTGNQQASAPQQPVVPIEQPVMGSFVMPNYQMPMNVSESTATPDARRQAMLTNAYENNIPITTTPPSLFDKVVGIGNIIDLGTSYIDRKLKLLKGDDEKTITKINLKQPKLEYEGEGEIKNAFEPITLGSVISDENDIKHRGKGFYHTSEMIDLDKFKFGFHNRKGMGSTTDPKTGVTKTEGLVIPVFDKEYEGEAYKDNEGKNSIRKYSDSEIKDDKLYGGVDDQGKFHLDFGKNLKGKNLHLADFRYEDVIGFAKDSIGNYILGDETSNKLIAKVPHLITVDGKEKPLNVLVPKNGKNQHLTYGETTGGRFILTTPDMKHKFLVSGSLQNLNDSLEEFKKRYNLSAVRVVILDNGTFSRGLRKTDKKIKKNDWKKYDEANDQGGAGFYYYENGGDVSELSEYYSNKLRDGGSIKNGTEMTVSTEQLENLKRQGYKIQML